MGQKEFKIKFLVRLAGKGAIWQFGGGTISSIIRLGSSAILARLLDPKDFGMLGMGLLVTNLVAYLGNMGINSAIIAKKDISSRDLSTAFTLLVINRLLLYIIIFWAAPLVGFFLGESQIVPVVRVTALVFVLSAFDSIPIALLSKELKYDSLFFINLVGTLFESFFAIFLAYYTNLAYWSLIYAMVGSYFLKVFMANFFSKWFPRTFLFSKESFSYFKKYVFAGIGNSIVCYFKDNIDYLIVGRKLGVHFLGLYEYAYKIPNMFMCRFIFPFSSVLAPALSQIQNDKSAVCDIFFRISRLMFFITFPSMACLAGLSDLFVPVVWGSRWISIIVPMKILCFAVSLELFSVLANPIFYIYKRPQLVFISNLIQVLSTFLFVYIGIYYWGLIGVSIGIMLGFSPAFFFFLMACRVINIHFKKLFYSIILIVFSSILLYLLAQLLVVCGKLFIMSHVILLFLSFLILIMFFLMISYFFLSCIYKDIFYLLRLVFLNK